LSRHLFLPHTRYLQNLRCTPLRLDNRRCGVCQLPSVFKERLPRSRRGADPALTASAKIKNPASSAGSVRPFSLVTAGGRLHSKLEFLLSRI
jgi:hypothetical protein